MLQANKAIQSLRSSCRKQLISLPYQYFNHNNPTLRSFSTQRRATTTLSSEAESLVLSIKQVGDQIRDLKASKADKTVIDQSVQELLSMKQKYESLTGQPYEANSKSSASKSSKANTKKSTESNESNDQTPSKSGMETVITPRTVDYSAWYNDVVAASDMVDQSAVRGCMVIKPWGMGVWDSLRSVLDSRIKDTGTENAYFPLFIPMSFLAKEAEHVDGFAKECAVVTHHRLCASPDGKGGLIPDPEAKLEEPLIVRPTSETVIWNMFAKWINSYRDLPLKVNQWANVVRWEMRTRPFLRTTEFLWQEGHTAHATANEAVGLAQEILDMYADVCQDVLAMPTVKGRKSPAERFAGADDTYTIEALMQNGWALQSGTSHFLGQNFARAFDVFFQDEKGGRELVWATSWGVSTRLLGAMIMTHSDDKGLVLPPRVAPVQVIIVPIIPATGDQQVAQKALELKQALVKQGLRVRIDDRPNMRPGAKYFEWERKGVPLRIELGARDLEKQVATIASRIGSTKSTLSITDVATFASNIAHQLDEVHDSLLNTAKQRLEQRTFSPKDYNAMKAMMEAGGDQAGFYLVPWKCDRNNEATIKEDCKATIRCYPLTLNENHPAAGVKCFYSGDQATHMAIFARAF